MVKSSVVHFHFLCENFKDPLKWSKHWSHGKRQRLSRASPGRAGYSWPPRIWNKVSDKTQLHHLRHSEKSRKTMGFFTKHSFRHGFDFASNSGIESYGLRIRMTGPTKWIFQYPKRYEIPTLHWYSTDVWPAANGKWCCWSFTQWTKILENRCSMMMFPKLGTHGILVGAAVYPVLDAW